MLLLCVRREMKIRNCTAEYTLLLLGIQRSRHEQGMVETGNEIHRFNPYVIGFSGLRKTENNLYNLDVWYEPFFAHRLGISSLHNVGWEA